MSEKKNSFLVIRVTEELKKSITEESGLFNMSASQYVRKILDRRLEVLPKKNG